MNCYICHKGPPEVEVMSCTLCRETLYCSAECEEIDWEDHNGICGKISNIPGSSSVPRDIINKPPSTKGLDIPIADPFARLKKGTWLHDRSETDVYRLLIDAFRLHATETCPGRHSREEGRLEREMKIFNGTPEGLRGFLRFLGRLHVRCQFLPPWWNDERRRDCVRFGMGTSQWSDLRCTVGKEDIIEHYGDKRFPFQLQLFAQAVLCRRSIWSVEATQEYRPRIAEMRDRMAQMKEAALEMAARPGCDPSYQAWYQLVFEPSGIKNRAEAMFPESLSLYR